MHNHNGFHSMPPYSEMSDEELMQRLAAGCQEALGLLYSRYARQIFHLAARTLDRPAAEEIMQDVFLTVWRGAGSFAPERGAFRSWVFQITRFRILNELRRRSRQPQVELDPGREHLTDFPNDSPELSEMMWREYRRTIVRAAFAELSPKQRQALGLAFFEDLSHEQVASLLNLPLGTAKTRIRDGLQKLRGKLAPLGAALALLLLAVFSIRYYGAQTSLQRDERALTLVTASDAENRRLASTPGMPMETHARYRGRTGTAMAVITFSHFPPAPVGQTYQVWVRHKGVWTSLGTVQPDSSGSARLIAENPALMVLPEAIEVTLEPNGESREPSARVVVAWPEGRAAPDDRVGTREGASTER